jgi:PAS domain S-box-containing protein
MKNNDNNKTKGQLIEDLQVLRKRCDEAELVAKNCKHMEAELRESEARLTAIIENLPFDFFMIGEDGKYILQNAACRKHGGEIVGKRPEDLSTDEKNLALWLDNNNRAFNGETVSEEVELNINGQLMFVYNIISPFWYEGKIRGIVGVNIDITDRIQAEEELRKFKTVSDRANYGTSISNLDGKIIYTNEAFADIYGYTPEEMIGLRVTDLHTEEQMPNHNKMMALLRREGGFNGQESWSKRKDGSVFPAQISASVINDDQGNPIFISATSLDNTKQLESQKALAESEQANSALLNAFDDVLFMCGPEGDLLAFNDAFSERHKRKPCELMGKNVFDLLPGPMAESRKNRLALALEKKDTVRWEDSRDERTYDNAICPVFSQEQSLKRFAIFSRDITEKKRMEKELIKAQKLDTIGLLAGGIAHDFNNILTGILGHLSLVRRKIEEKEKVLHLIDESEAACNRAVGLTNQLLTFSKGGEPVKTSISVADILRESCVFALRGSNVKCEFDINEDLWAVQADPSQLNQAFNNLIINSDQAMPKGGTINVKADNCLTDDITFPVLSDEKYIKITFEDQGIGIPPDYLDKVFDPFFTTKEKGSGLGLATTYSIIKKHDGAINVESNLGKGSVFYVFLPASEYKTKDTFPSPEIQEPCQNKKRILVMDDDNTIRELSAQLIEELGHEPEVARNGNEALEKFNTARKKGRSFDVVILDLTIPGGLGGKETIDEILKIDPHAKAIVASGYSNDPIMANFRDYGFMGVIAKPYGIEEVANALNLIFNKSQ